MKIVFPKDKDQRMNDIVACGSLMAVVFLSKGIAEKQNEFLLRWSATLDQIYADSFKSNGIKDEYELMSLEEAKKYAMKSGSVFG